MTSSSTQVTITEKAYDLFYVDILNQTLLYQSFDFIIYGEDHKMLRKGHFRSPSAQLRTSDLKEGSYEFQLLFNGQEWHTSQFEKKQHPVEKK